MSINVNIKNIIIDKPLKLDCGKLSIIILLLMRLMAL